MVRTKFPMFENLQRQIENTELNVKLEVKINLESYEVELWIADRKKYQWDLETQRTEAFLFIKNKIAEETVQ